MWNGTAETLKASPATTNTRPMTVPISFSFTETSAREIYTKAVPPQKP